MAVGRAGLIDWQPLNALLTIVNALNKQRIEEGRRQDKSELSAEEHKALRDKLNNSGFLAPIDADGTQNNISNIEKRVIRYCRYIGWLQAIKNCDKGFIMSFLHYICENDRVGSVHTLHHYKTLIANARGKEDQFSIYTTEFEWAYH